MAMEATELARWTRFAAKGGIGKCTAIVDWVAENSDDLMFMRNDEITVLMQLPNPPGAYLGYCEGVVGRFDGLNVLFHGRLKKPVMAKRSSVNASNPGARKSPTPPVTRTRVSIDEHGATTFVLPPSSPDGIPGVTKTSKLRFSVGQGSRRSSSGQERSDGEYGSSRGASPAIPSTASPSLKEMPPLLHAATPPSSAVSYGSPKSPLRVSISSRHASVLSSYSQVSEYEEDSSRVNTSVDTVTNADVDASGRASVASVSSRQPTSSPPTMTTNGSTTEPTIIPPSISDLSNSSLYASSSGTSTTTPLTFISPPATSLPTASTVPDSSGSTSTYFDTSRLSIASDGEVGIGLSLLQNLADADGWSGSESESDAVVSRRKASVRSKGSVRRRTSLRKQTAAASGQWKGKGNEEVRDSFTSIGSRYSSDDGLNYADTETGHSSISHPSIHLTQEELDADILQTQAAFSQHLEHLDDDEDNAESPILGRHSDTPNGNGDTLGQRMMTFPPVAPLSPSPSRLTHPNAEEESFASTYEFPTPPTHTHRISLSQASTTSTSLNSRPTSFVRPPRLPTENTSTTSSTTNARPSTAQSSTSSNWHDDIYDDYRYSRVSLGTRSFSSHVSVSSRINNVSGSGLGMGGAEEWPPERMERPSIDGASSISGSGTASMRGSVDLQGSGQGRPGVGRTRSRSNTTASLNPVVLSPTVPQAAPTFVQARSPPPVRMSPPSKPPSLHRSSPQLSYPPTQSPVPSIHSPPLSRQLEVNRVLGLGHRTSDSESDGSVRNVQSSPRIDGTFSVLPSARLDRSYQDPIHNAAPRTTSTLTRPTPLKLLSSNHSAPAPLSAPQSPLSPNHHQQRQEPSHSPLLHTSWGSAVSSATSAVQSATISATLPHPSSSSPPSSGGRVTGSSFFPCGLDLLGKMTTHQEVEVEMRRDREGGEMARRIVNEEDDGQVIPRRGGSVLEEHERENADRGNQEDDCEDGDIVGDNTTFVTGGRLHDSPSIASSPEPEPERLVSFVTNRTEDVEDDEDAEELEREKENLRREAAGVVNRIPASVPARQAPTPQEVMTPPPLGSSVPAITTAVIPPSPPPTTSVLPPPSHLRPPKLSDIRPTGERQSLFLPHPNAPKATPTSISPGPRYITSQTQPPSSQPNSQRVRGSAMQAIHMALSGQGPGSGPRGRGPTIYGIVTADLSAAMGPILIQFAITPPPATAPPPGSSLPRGASTPAASTRIKATPSSQPPQSVAVPVPNIVARRTGSVASLDIKPTGNTVADVERPVSGTGGVIPRANFFPKAGGVRPRSRSFSGFHSNSAEIPIPMQRSRDSNDQPAQVPTARDMKHSLSPITGSPATPTGKLGPRPSPLREFLPVPPLRAPTSPLANSFVVPYNQQSSSSVPSSPMSTSPPRLLRQTASRPTLNDTSISRSIPHTHLTLDNVNKSPSPSAQHTPEFRTRLSVEIDSGSIHSAKSNLTSPPPTTVGRQNSLRNKLSLPNLRRKQDESSSLQPMSPTAEANLLQVQDMDFELVRPTFGHLLSDRSSDDSGVMGRDLSVDARHDGKFLRADSPALSLIAPRSPTYTSDTNSSTLQGSKSGRGGTDSEASSTSVMDAHRNRELKWMTVLGSVQPSQSRKNKKVKKLIFEGVPSSVRYPVWFMLTDGKARCVPGVYAQLGSRAKVAALADIERDVQRCFADRPQLQSTQGPVLSLLQAYLTMVPDVQYATGLTLIVGNLLLHAPEEDAFWTFVSLMDTHIRPYFSSTSVQVEVDAMLFERSLDNADPALAKKLFKELNISPVGICRPWFTSLFVGILSPDYLDRVWDIFLFEGVPFLFRVALVLVSCSRQRVFNAKSADAALSAVLRPSPEFLPSSPEVLVTLALAVKVKDDDLRKQRVKLEAQAKRQTLAPRSVSTPGSISLPRP